MGKNWTEAIIEDTMVKNFLKLTKDMKAQIQEVLQILTRVKTEKITPRHITVEVFLKHKDQKKKKANSQKWPNIRFPNQK